MTEEEPSQASPGALLRSARERAGISAEDVATELNWLPGYVALIEGDDYQALRSPAFARGYVRAYGRFLRLDEQRLMSEYEARQAAQDEAFERRRVRTRQLHLQRSGAGVLIGLLTLGLLVAALWWWQGGRNTAAPGLATPLPEQEVDALSMAEQ